MRVTTVLMMAAATTALGCNMAGDQDVGIGSEVSCPSCSIVINTVVTLEHVFFTGPSTAIARDSIGMFYVVDRTDGLLKAFGSDGRLVRSIGRHGGGPGEYEMVRNILVARDGSIQVLDMVLGRRSVFGRDGEVVSTTRVPLPPAFSHSAVLRSDGQLAISAVSTAAAAGWVNAVQLIDAEGNVTSSVDKTLFDRNAQWRQERLLWGRQNGELLVARPYSLTIDVYTSDLTKKGSITRVADWFPSREPEGEPSDGLFDEPLTPRLMAIWEDGRGLLWFEVVVPSPSWTPKRRVADLSKEAYAKLGSRPRFETIIEVLDVERRRVLARSRFNDHVGVAFGRGFYATPVEDSIGEPHLRISHIELKQ